MKDKNITIAIIGFGRLGKLLAEILLKYTQASIIVISSKKIKQTNKRIQVVSMTDISQASIIIPCVPIVNFESVIKVLALHINPQAIVIDVCSVKVLPVSIMKKHLPKTVQIVATHPMFGPDAYRIKDGLKDMRIVLWNVRVKEETYQQIKNWCKNLELHVVELSPEDHDRHMAFSLGYSYFIGKIGQHMEISKTPIDTYDFQLLLENISIVQNDSEQLFFDMQTQNPFAKDMHKQFTKTMNQLLSDIDKK